MRLSQYFLPTLKETPSEAQIVSHRLMLRAGMIRQQAAGIYSWLPMGLRVLRKIEQVVREEQDKVGCLELLMPTIQSSELWRESGRYEAYGPEMLRIEDRHGHEMLYGPSNEEMITDIFRNSIKSYKDLPKNLYQIQWKFRDEIRPRFGVMRGREFLMKDGYSFDLTPAAARRAYDQMFVSYLRTFQRLGMKAVPIAAESGPIGGSMSHEFVILAEAGETKIQCHRDLLTFEICGEINYDDDLRPIVDQWTSLYAATAGKCDAEKAAALGDALITARGIEVGHIFNFGTKYSQAMNAFVTGPNGEEIPVEMGSYGIGLSRLAGAIIEACHDDGGIVWPDAVAPFQVGIINVKTGNPACNDACEDLYKGLSDSGVETLFDDRNCRAGVKFADMDLIGLPWQVITGPKSLEKGVVELKRRKTGERQEVLLSDVMSKITSH